MLYTLLFEALFLNVILVYIHVAFVQVVLPKQFAAEFLGELANALPAQRKGKLKHKVYFLRKRFYIGIFLLDIT